MAGVHTRDQLWAQSIREKEGWRRETLSVMQENIFKLRSMVSCDLEDPDFNMLSFMTDEPTSETNVRVSFRKVTDYMELVVCMDASVVDDMCRYHHDGGRDVFDFRRGAADPTHIFGCPLILTTSRHDLLLPTQYLWRQK